MSWELSIYSRCFFRLESSMGDKQFSRIRLTAGGQLTEPIYFQMASRRGASAGHGSLTSVGCSFFDESGNLFRS
jgi:hypothetical protein